MLLQMQSNRIFKVAHNRESGASAKLMSIWHGAAQKKSGETFFMELEGKCNLTPRQSCGELCVPRNNEAVLGSSPAASPLSNQSDASQDYGCLQCFAGKALRVSWLSSKATQTRIQLKVSVTPAVRVDIDQANSDLASEEHPLLLEFR